MDARTLVLTRSYMPHQISSWGDAIGKLFTDRVQVLEEYAGDEHVVGVIPERRVCEFRAVARAYPAYAGGDLVIRVPAVMRLTEYHGTMKRGVKFSRTNVFTRDGYRCQYCRQRLGARSLNYDHVIPRHLGGRTVWENIVASCYPCNSRKANRTPQQAGMTLMRQPFKPKSLPMTGPKFSPMEIHPSWLAYCVSFLGDEVAASA
jgi:5-methylcytosine-specific restriction endonuclease McrA